MDSPAQIDGGSSKPFWLIRFKNVIYKQNSCRANYRLPKYLKVDIRTIFGDDFYTIPLYKTLPGPPEPLELPENPQLKLKSIQIFPKSSEIECGFENHSLCHYDWVVRATYSSIWNEWSEGLEESREECSEGFGGVGVVKEEKRS